MIRRALALLALLFATLSLAPAPARADDISATARGVVRIVTIAMVEGQVVGFGHGSGFAVAPNRIVTNAHVVELASRYPENVVIGVVPSEGDKSFQGKVVAFDAQRDLALIEFEGQRLPPVALYTGPVDEGAPVTALGYPGNVDLATAQSATDYIHPLSPIRSEGVFSGRRALSGIEVLLHTAGIARGNSGGPLLDPCGRVIGVNSAITRGEDGDTSFGFAIADSELATFLRGAAQPYTAVGTGCTSMADRLKQDSAADAQAIADAAAAQREAVERAAVQREQALDKARADAERERENFMAAAAVLLVLGALSLGGAGLLATRGQRTPAIVAAAGGVVLVIGAVVIFLVRPSGEASPSDTAAAARAVPTPDAVLASGPLNCRVVAERSRITVSSTADLRLDWGSEGCVNRRTQYVSDGSRWSRILVPEQEQTVSVLQFDPATRSYANTRYLLSAAQMEAIRKLRGTAPVKGCSADATQLALLGQQQAAIRAALPAYPNEKIVYSCSPAPNSAD
ncbi:S1C family serine protease [Sphingomonas aracearum]|uniref:Serine protease n=1 Tax=Sphingomonas aracearum TaxID=2283317 RepID=A0A369VYJ3_9SPHN|nr:trypsin-like peptidase domain-containing protein [Sphingomonas aracearum]RDE06697.1 serine protease [Sphingomonas aracearum]